LGGGPFAARLSDAPRFPPSPTYMAYEPTLPRDAARNLRTNATEAEQKLWSRLRKRQLDGFQFRRQHSIGPFFMDFVCLEAMLVVEVDGSQQRSEKIRTKGGARFCVIMDIEYCDFGISTY
jgi:very-short-patch-repair endonuclease